MNVLEKFSKITTLVFDVDGVLTDGSLLVMPNGLFARRMNIKDGYALQLAVKKGYHILVISGARSAEVEDRLRKLGLTAIYMGIENKLETLNAYLKQYELTKNEVLYMGDDIPDLKVMETVALACCPADAVAEIKEISSYISPINGGYGCVRDVVEKVMKVRGDWNEDTTIRAK